MASLGSYTRSAARATFSAYRSLPIRWRLAGGSAGLTFIILACFAAIVASLISSRVRTYNAAQQIGGLVLMPVWGVMLGLAVKLQDWGPTALVSAVTVLALIDVLLTVMAATTWRREEVLSHT